MPTTSTCSATMTFAHNHHKMEVHMYVFQKTFTDKKKKTCTEFIVHDVKNYYNTTLFNYSRLYKVDKSVIDRKTKDNMLDIIPLCPELQEVAIKELNETPTRIEENLCTLKQWIRRQPHLKVRDDDRLLLQFLRGSKFSLEKVKQRIDMYYTLKSRFPELFLVTDVKSPAMRDIIDLGCFSPLLNKCGPAIAVLRFNFSASKHSVQNVIRYLSLLQDLPYICDPYACVSGVIYIVDLEKLPTNYLPYLTPSLLKKTFDYFLKTLPYRIKAVYIINNSPFVMQFVKLVLPFIPEKIKQRIHFCGNDMEELSGHLPLKFLPKDYGGTNSTLAEHAMWLQEMIYENAEYFEENDKYGIDETLRPGKPINFDSIYGMEGTFRKLEVD